MNPEENDHRLDLAETRTVEPAAPTAAPTLPEIIKMHPYSLLLGGAALLVVFGAFVVITRTPTSVSPSDTVAWGGGGALTPPYGAANSSVQQSGSILEQVESAPPYNYILPTPQTVTVQSGAGSGFDFDSFISMLSQENATTSAGQTVDGGAAAYAFIPTGLVSVEAPATRSALQDSLYQYGNDVGSFIQSFESENPNESQTLWDQAQDRADAGKAAALVALAHSLSSLGASLLSMDNVPQQADSAHAALAQSYQDLGKKLAAVPGAQSDTDFLAAIAAYNAAAQTFTKNYVALANLFVLYGVRFSPADSGSVFTFTSQAL